MKVYKFYSASSGLRNLAQSRLKVSQLSELNDPFEFAGIDLRQKDTRVKFNLWRNKENEETGLISFCQSHYNPLMWAHYADNHQGICMEFEVSENLLKKVVYVKQRYKKFDNPDIFLSEILNEHVRERLLTMKFSHWSYEKEQRLIIPLEKCTKYGGLYFKDFQNGMKLTKIYLGYQFSEFKRLSQILENHSKNLVRKKRPAFGKYRMVQQMDWRLKNTTA